MTMLRVMVFGAALLVAACATQEAPTPAAGAPPPPQQSADAGPSPGGPSPAAPGVSVEPDRPPPPPSGDITVPSGQTRPVTAPRGDPRTNEQRMADIRRWDNCVMRLQNEAEGSPNRPALDTPEEVCARSLGMHDRTAVPDARRDAR